MFGVVVLPQKVNIAYLALPVAVTARQLNQTVQTSRKPKRGFAVYRFKIHQWYSTHPKYEWWNIFKGAELTPWFKIIVIFIFAPHFRSSRSVVLFSFSPWSRRSCNTCPSLSSHSLFNQPSNMLRLILLFSILCSFTAANTICKNPSSPQQFAHSQPKGKFQQTVEDHQIVSPTSQQPSNKLKQMMWSPSTLEVIPSSPPSWHTNLFRLLERVQDPPSSIVPEDPAFNSWARQSSFKE